MSSRTIGKLFGGDVSRWPAAANFKSVSNLHFIKFPESVYAYRICSALIDGVVESDLQYLKVGPFVQSRWLCLSCCISLLRYYILLDKLSLNLEILANFCLQVYFPSWFEIKSNSQLTCGSRNLFNLNQKILQIPNETVRETALKGCDEMDCLVL